MKLVRIPAGEYWRGSARSDPDAQAYEMPRHRVRITRPFWMGAHEVTVGQFARFVEATDYRTTAETGRDGGWGYNSAGELERTAEYDWRHTGFEQSDQHPVVNVSWDDASAFCRWLSGTEGRQYRLPTDAEWEYACRAGTLTRFQSGETWSGLSKLANVYDLTLNEVLPTAQQKRLNEFDGFAFTAPVGSFRPNAFGLYDMHGNVWEWCLSNGPYKEFQGRVAVDPEPVRSPILEGPHPVRGGSWRNEPIWSRSASKTWYWADDCDIHIGFRVVLATED